MWVLPKILNGVHVFLLAFMLPLIVELLQLGIAFVMNRGSIFDITVYLRVKSGKMGKIVRK